MILYLNINYCEFYFEKDVILYFDKFQTFNSITPYHKNFLKVNFVRDFLN